jgi:hypothetical protein
VFGTGGFQGLAPHSNGPWLRITGFLFPYFAVLPRLASLKPSVLDYTYTSVNHPADLNIQKDLSFKRGHESRFQEDASPVRKRTCFGY